jgi:hypothetical protein
VGDGSTTFNLPNSIGKHDEGVGGGDVGTDYAQSIQAHVHSSGTLTTSNDTHNHDVYFTDSLDGGGLQNQLSNVSGSDGSNKTSSDTHNHSISGNTGSFGDAVTRPASVGFLPCIWYE